MGRQRNLIYYSSVATRDVRIIAEYVHKDKEFSSIAAKCLDRLPPLHSRFSYTTARRMFGCIIEKSFIFCAISDQALGKTKAFSFIEQLRDEFKVYMRIRGLSSDGSGLKAHSLDGEFAPIFRCLVIPFAGVPQIEKDRIQEMQAQQNAGAASEMNFPSALASLDEDDEQPLNREKRNGYHSASTAVIGRSTSYKHKNKKAADDQNTESSQMGNKGKFTNKGQKLDIVVQGSSQSSTSAQMQKAVSMRRRAQQMADRVWWRKLKIVLLLDGIVCAILLGVYLFICRGFRCLHKDPAGQ